MTIHEDPRNELKHPEPEIIWVESKYRDPRETLFLVAIQAVCLTLSQQARETIARRIEALRKQTALTETEAIDTEAKIGELEILCRRTGHSGFEWNPHFIQHVIFWIERAPSACAQFDLMKPHSAYQSIGEQPDISWENEYRIAAGNSRNSAEQVGRLFDHWKPWKTLANKPLCQAIENMVAWHYITEKIGRKANTEAGEKGKPLPYTSHDDNFQRWPRPDENPEHQPRQD